MFYGSSTRKRNFWRKIPLTSDFGFWAISEILIRKKLKIFDMSFWADFGHKIDEFEFFRTGKQKFRRKLVLETGFEGYKIFPPCFFPYIVFFFFFSSLTLKLLTEEQTLVC